MKKPVKFGNSPGMLLRAAYLSFHRYAHSHFSRGGLTADQFVLLSLLFEEDGLLQKELGQRASTDPNTTASMLKLLEARTFIERRKDDADGRALRVYLTSGGRKKLKSARLNGAIEDRLRELMDPAARELVTAWLK